MRRSIVVAVLAALASLAAYCCVNFQIELHRGQQGLESITIRPKAGRSRSGESWDDPSDGSLPPAIRIATFNLSGLDEQKLANPRVAAVLARVIPRFDLVAVQGIRAGNQAVLVRLVDQLNAAGGQYDFATCPSATSGEPGQHSAFLLSRATVEVDRATVQLVEDPQRRFRHRPLVALFRTRGPDPSQAFTFKLINVHTEADRSAVELELLDDVYKAVRDADPGEDDVILLGELGEVAGQDPLGEMPAITLAITSTPTTLQGTVPVDNIVFDPRATAEFSGRAGVLDLMREYELTWREVSEISDHLPVWAEFSSIEGMEYGHMAGRGTQTNR